MFDHKNIKLTLIVTFNVLHKLITSIKNQNSTRVGKIIETI